MTYLKLLPLEAALPCLVALAIAAPAPQGTKTAISAANAGEVRPVAELERRVHRIIRGPGRGELTFLDGNNAVEVVDDVDFRPLRKVAEGHRPIDFAASRDGRLRAWNERNKAAYVVQDVAGGKTFAIEAGKVPGHSAFSPDGKLLAIGDTVVTAEDPEGGGYSEMKLWDVSGQLVRTLEKSGQGVLTPVFSPDGKLLAVGNRNRETRLFEVATGKLSRTLGREMTQEIAFSPDGKTLAAGYVDGTVALWDVATGRMLGSEPTGCQEVFSLDWSPKGDVLVTSGLQGRIVLWELRTLAMRKESEAPAWVIQVRFTVDGSRLLCSSASDLAAKKDRKVVVWAVPDGVDR